MHTIQLNQLEVKVMGELKYVLIRVASNPHVDQIIGIIVVDIPKPYVFLLSKDW